MKRHLLFKSLLLLCALVVGTSSSWADTETVTPTNSPSAGFTGASHFTYVAEKLPSGSTNPAFAADNVKLYVNNTLTITPEAGETITGVSISATWNQGGSGKNKAYPTGISSSPSATLGDATPGTGSHTITWSGSTTSGVTFTINGSKGNLQVTSITVTYSPASSSPLDHISLSGTYPTSFFVGDAFSHEGMTVTAHYEDTSTSDVTSSATFTGYNMSTAGNQTVTVSYTKGAVEKTATYNITVLPAPTAVVTLDFTNSGWGFPADYVTDAATYTNNGYTITLGASSNGHKKMMSGENIVSLIFGKENATITLPAFGFNVSKIMVYGYSGASSKTTFNVYVGDVAVSTQATDATKNHDFVIAADKQAPGTIYTIKVTNSNNCQISKIVVYGDGCEAGLVQSYGWATYIPTANVEYPANTAYVVTDASVSTGLTLAEVTQVPLGTPLLLKGEGAKTAIVLDAAPAAPSKNLLEVSDGSDLSSDEYPYVLAKNGASACFKQWTGDMSALNGRVMLVLDENIAAARGIFELDDDATGIKQVETSKQNAEGFYNLAGQRVANPTKGLYIVNGKKVIIK